MTSIDVILRCTYKTLLSVMQSAARRCAFERPTIKSRVQFKNARNVILVFLGIHTQDNKIRYFVLICPVVIDRSHALVHPRGQILGAEEMRDSEKREG